MIYHIFYSRIANKLTERNMFNMTTCEPRLTPPRPALLCLHHRRGARGETGGQGDRGTARRGQKCGASTDLVRRPCVGIGEARGGEVDRPSWSETLNYRRFVDLGQKTPNVHL